MTRALCIRDIRRELVRGYLADVARRPFVWGRMDCAMFAAGMVRRLAGIDVRSVYTYASQVGARRTLAARGRTLRDEVTFHLGEPRVDWENCQDGDIVLADLGDGDTLGIATPSNSKAHFKSERYVVTIPLGEAREFWAVPCR